MIQLIQELLTDFGPERIVRLKQADSVSQLGGIPTNSVVPSVVFTVLDVVATHHLGLIWVVSLVLQEVDLFQEPLLMMLQLTDHQREREEVLL